MTGRASRDRDERLPERMRDYRIEAEPRQSPDLHKLVQLFIGMARSRAEQDRTTPATDADTAFAMPTATLKRKSRRFCPMGASCSAMKNRNSALMPSRRCNI